MEGRMRWLDAIDDAAAADAEVGEIMLAMQQLSFANAAPSGTLPAVTEDDGPDLGWVSELVM